MMARISMTLERRDGRVCCASCKVPIAVATDSWKARAALNEVPVARLPGAGLGVDRNVVIRQFSCPSCGALLDSETALPGDPFLEDMVSG
jgi:acetone carboxylase gamma subunit